MSEKSLPGSRIFARLPSIPDAWASALLLLLAVACALFLLWLPRPVQPQETPGLRLPVAEVNRVLQRDRAAERATLPEAMVAQLQRLYRDQGRFETRIHFRSEARERAQELRELLRLFRKKQGDEGVSALRSRAVASLRSALDLELDDEETRGVMGSFAKTLRMYGASRDGELVAPWFVVRTMYEARWNMVHALAPTDGMERVELLAYYGWLALQAETAPMAMRLKAVERYASLGGAGAEEAWGVLAYRAGDLVSAQRHLRAAYRKRNGWRLRNYLLAVQRARGG
jgi:hypothetical protein